VRRNSEVLTSDVDQDPCVFVVLKLMFKFQFVEDVIVIVKYVAVSTNVVVLLLLLLLVSIVNLYLIVALSRVSCESLYLLTEVSVVGLTVVPTFNVLLSSR